jgi:hypothetical protein
MAMREKKGLKRGDNHVKDKMLSEPCDEKKHNNLK